MIRVVLFDLDGVIRHFDSRYAADIEVKYGLGAGTLDDVAFTQPLLGAVTTGRIARAEWIRQIGEIVGSSAAATEWGSQPWSVDEALLQLSDELRDLGYMTAVLTNGTDTIAAEVAAMDIAGRFDAIFNSADIGFTKPDVRAFTHVLDALGVAPEEVFFTDDSASKLVGADRLMMHTQLFESVPRLRDRLKAAGVGLRDTDTAG